MRAGRRQTRSSAGACAGGPATAAYLRNHLPMQPYAVGEARMHFSCRWHHAAHWSTLLLPCGLHPPPATTNRRLNTHATAVHEATYLPSCCRSCCERSVGRYRLRCPSKRQMPWGQPFSSASCRMMANASCGPGQGARGKGRQVTLQEAGELAAALAGLFKVTS